MEHRMNTGITTWDMWDLTTAEWNTILRALHRSYKEHNDTEAESVRIAMLGGSLPG